MVLNRLDKERLGPVVAAERAPGWPVCRLREVLESASAVPARRVPPDVVTMNSRVRVRDLQWDEVETLTLVYPESAAAVLGEAAFVEVAAGREAVSVTSPMGAALLGARVGEEARWMGARGPRRVLVEAIDFQPEKEGRFEL